MELARFPSRGGFSVRSIITFVLAVLTTVVFWAIISGTTAHAADASWNGAAIKYDNHQYTSAGKIQKDDGTGLPADSPYYIYVEEPQVTGTSGQTLQKAHIIYFTPGTDPPTATSANYAVYDYNASAAKKFSNPSDQKTISLDTSSANSEATSCAVEGIGWFVCPVTTWLGGGMDFIFKLIAGFMQVQPLETGNMQGSLYSAWNTMRNIANIAFIIAFIIIIYAQLTNVQVNNYGLKKLLPRVIIAAIAINLSYIICAAAVDISNVLGYAFQDVFNNLKDHMLAQAGPDNGAALVSWQSITGFVLSGGTAVAAGVIGSVAAVSAAGGTVTAALFILLPALVGLLMAILVVLLILAARQALIVILVIIAPLALVAYLLPNTEKWFKKWRDLLMTMLIFFPAFSVVFGGSQLAGAIIMKNATSINMLILGMIVQVAPLVITPLLLKFSGSVLGNIARIANNPNKGILDRTRNWSKQHADWHRERGISGMKRNGDPGQLKGHNALRRSARYLDQRKKRLGDLTSNAGTLTQVNYENSDRYSKNGRNGKYKYDMALQKATLEDMKSATHNHHDEHINKARRTEGSLIYQAGIDAASSKDRADASQKYTEAFYNNARRDKKLAGGALHASSYQLQLANDKAQTSENLKNAYYNEQRTTRGTDLYAAVKPLETSKLRVEAAQNSYTAMVDNMKAVPNTRISAAAQRAASTKELADAAQARLQAVFDEQRSTPGTILSNSTLELQGSKTAAEGAAANLSAFINNEKSRVGGSLREQTVVAEQAKISQQIAESRVTGMVEGFKSGKLDPTTLTANERALMENMKAEAILLSAEKQAITSAQYEVQRNIADVMTGTAGDQPLTDAMLNIAQGVGGDVARLRAQSQAVTAAKSLDADALKANVGLLKDEAERSGTNIKRYSDGLLNAVLKGQPMYNDLPITPERIKAALQAQAEEKNIALFEDIRGSTRFDQAMVSEIIGLNNTNFKVAGGFGLQDNPTLNIDTYASKEEFEHALRVQRISNLANTNASGLSGLKFGWVAKSLANPTELKKNIEAVLLDVKNGKKPGASDDEIAAGQAAEASLKAAYNTVRGALTNPDTLDTINDRESLIRTIEAELARIHGQPPVPAAPIELNVDADSYLNMEDPQEVQAENLTDTIADTDDNLNQSNPEPDTDNDN